MVNEPLRGAGRREVRDIPGWVASRAAGSDETETGPTAGAEEPVIPGIDDREVDPEAGPDVRERPDAG